MTSSSNDVIFFADDGFFQDELVSGYDLVICTPPFLLRLLEIPELFNFKRLCHLILDEAHILYDSYVEEVRIGLLMLGVCKVAFNVGIFFRSTKS